MKTARTLKSLDIEVKIEASSLEALFLEALKATDKMLNKNYVRELNGHVILREIAVSSQNASFLLSDFLSGVLVLSNTNRAVFYRAEFLEIDDNHLYGHLVGTKIINLSKDIGSITCQSGEINFNSRGNFETYIIFNG